MMEDGVRVMFGEEAAGRQLFPPAGGVGAAEADGEQATYRHGGYWLVPLRVTLADVLWPRAGYKARAPLPLPPHGVDRHYAPFALIQVAGDGTVSIARDLRRELRRLTG